MHSITERTMLKNEGFGTEYNFSKIVNDTDQTDLEKQK